MGTESTSTGDVGVPTVGGYAGLKLAVYIDPSLGKPCPPPRPVPLDPMRIQDGSVTGLEMHPGPEQAAAGLVAASGIDIAATQAATSSSFLSIVGGFASGIAIALAA